MIEGIKPNQDSIKVGSDQIKLDSALNAIIPANSAPNNDNSLFAGIDNLINEQTQGTISRPKDQNNIIDATPVASGTLDCDKTGKPDKNIKHNKHHKGSKSHKHHKGSKSHKHHKGSKSHKHLKGLKLKYDEIIMGSLNLPNITETGVPSTAISETSKEISKKTSKGISKIKAKNLPTMDSPKVPKNSTTEPSVSPPAVSSWAEWVNVKPTNNSSFTEYFKVKDKPTTVVQNDSLKNFFEE
jgi:hypothetical protein